MCNSSDTSNEDENSALVKVSDKHEDKAEVQAMQLEKASDKNEPATYLKWGALFLLVFQNSGIFLLMRYTRSLEGPKYYSSVTVWFSEVFKGAICLTIMLVNHIRAGTGLRGLVDELREEMCVQRREMLKLAIPAFCYTIQNNLLFLAVSHMSAAASQVLYQAKTLSTAFFSVVILKKRYLALQWLSFVLLGVGVALVQNQDAKASESKPGQSPLLGAAASLVAAALSGFAGVYLELMFNRGATSIWMRNVQLCIFTIPLQTFTVYQSDGKAIAHHGAMYGFQASTWGVVAIQVAGGLIVAVVIKYAGNILKTFAAVLAIILTCFVSYLLPMLGFTATPLFFSGLLTVFASIWMYAQPKRLPWIDPPAQ